MRLEVFCRLHRHHGQRDWHPLQCYFCSAKSSQKLSGLNVKHYWLLSFFFGGKRTTFGWSQPLHKPVGTGFCLIPKKKDKSQSVLLQSPEPLGKELLFHVAYAVNTKEGYNRHLLFPSSSGFRLGPIELRAFSGVLSRGLFEPL